VSFNLVFIVFRCVLISGAVLIVSHKVILSHTFMITLLLVSGSLYVRVLSISSFVIFFIFPHFVVSFKVSGRVVVSVLLNISCIFFGQTSFVNI